MKKYIDRAFQVYFENSNNRVVIQIVASFA